MNKDRRKLIAGIFADAAKYTLTAGLIGSVLAERFSMIFGLKVGISFGLLLMLAYAVMPASREGTRHD